MPQEVHPQRLPQSPHGERARGNGELEAAVCLYKDNFTVTQPDVSFCSHVLLVVNHRSKTCKCTFSDHCRPSVVKEFPNVTVDETHGKYKALCLCVRDRAR